MKLKDDIAKAINKYLQMNLDYTKEVIVVPKERKNGDYSFPCFKVTNSNPIKLAEDLQENIKSIKGVTFKKDGPYLNFYIDNNSYYKEIVENILHDKKDFDYVNEFRGKNIILNHDYYGSLSNYMNLNDDDLQAMEYFYYKLFTQLGFNVYWLSNLKINYSLGMKKVYDELKNKRFIEVGDNFAIINLKEFNMPPYMIIDKYSNLNNRVMKYINDFRKINIERYISFNEDYNSLKINMEKNILVKLNYALYAGRIEAVDVNLKNLYTFKKKHNYIINQLKKCAEFITEVKDYKLVKMAMTFQYNEEKELIEKLNLNCSYMQTTIEKLDEYIYLDYLIELLVLTEKLMATYKKDMIEQGFFMVDKFALIKAVYKTAKTIFV